MLLPSQLPGGGVDPDLWRIQVLLQALDEHDLIWMQRLSGFVLTHKTHLIDPHESHRGSVATDDPVSNRPHRSYFLDCTAGR
jgi:hypothetical protein